MAKMMKTAERAFVRAAEERIQFKESRCTRSCKEKTVRRKQNNWHAREDVDELRASPPSRRRSAR